MHVTTKGQVTIPQAIRDRLGLLPHTEVEFELAEDHAVLRKKSVVSGAGERGRRAIAALRGTARSGMSTDEIMALTRGEVDDGSHFPDSRNDYAVAGEFSSTATS